MVKSFLLFFFLYQSTNLFGQEDFKKPDPFTLNLLVGYESYNNFTDINNNLILNGFKKLNYSNLAFGIEFSGSNKRSHLIDQIYFTNIPKSKPQLESQLGTASFSILYGYDILPKARNTFLYPLAGIRMNDVSVYSKRSDDIIIDAHKPIFEGVIGFETRQFLNKNMTGALNNLGLTFLISFPIFNSRWHKDGRAFISDTYKVNPTFSINFSFGRGFYPATIE